MPGFELADEQYNMLIVSRRSRYNAGTRFIKRGINLNSNCVRRSRSSAG